jgi:hypothetical protein
LSCLKGLESHSDENGVSRLAPREVQDTSPGQVFRKHSPLEAAPKPLAYQPVDLKMRLDLFTNLKKIWGYTPDTIEWEGRERRRGRVGSRKEEEKFRTGNRRKEEKRRKKWKMKGGREMERRKQRSQAINIYDMFMPLC